MPSTIAPVDTGSGQGSSIVLNRVAVGKTGLYVISHQGNRNAGALPSPAAYVDSAEAGVIDNHATAGSTDAECTVAYCAGAASGTLTFTLASSGGYAYQVYEIDGTLDTANFVYDTDWDARTAVTIPAQSSLTTGDVMLALVPFTNESASTTATSLSGVDASWFEESTVKNTSGTRQPALSVFSKVATGTTEASEAFTLASGHQGNVMAVRYTPPGGSSPHVFHGSGEVDAVKLGSSTVDKIMMGANQVYPPT